MDCVEFSSYYTDIMGDSGSEYGDSPSHIFFTLQVATALLVAGPTLTSWIPGQTLFTPTSLYSVLIQWLARITMGNRTM